MSHVCYGCGSVFDGEENDEGDVRCTDCGSEDTASQSDYEEFSEGGGENVFTDQTGMVCEDCGSTFEDADIHFNDDSVGECPSCLSDNIHGA